jgi:hypothetical protein
LALCAVSRLDNVTTIVINWLFVALLIGAEIMKFILLHRDGEPGVETGAPTHLCNWAMLTAERAYYPKSMDLRIFLFLGIGRNSPGATDARSPYGFPDPRFINFFMLHGRVTASTLQMTPLPGSAVRPDVDRACPCVIDRLSRRRYNDELCV